MLTLHFGVQDCVCLVAPYPYRLQPLEDFDPIGDLDISCGGDLWYARPLLFFRCTLCPPGKMGDARTHKEFSLVFFSTFEPINLTPDSCMQRKGVRTGCNSGAVPLCLPGGEYSGTFAFDSMLLEWQFPQYHSAQLQV